MLDPYGTDVVAFASSIPADSNPYLAMADHLKARLQPRPVPSWGRWLTRCALFGFLVMWLQSCRLLYVRFGTKSFHAVSFNRLGLLRVDLLGVTAVGYFVYSLLTITDMILVEFILAGRRDQTWEIFLLGIKLLVMFDVSCTLLWVCACQVASLLWASSDQKKPLPGVIRWAMNIFCVTLLLAPIRMSFLVLLFVFLLLRIFSSWAKLFYRGLHPTTHFLAPLVLAYGRANAEYVAIKNILTPLINSLRNSAKSYSPKEYRPLQMLISLKPVESVDDHYRLLVYFFEIGSQTYLSMSLITLVAYIPLLKLTLKEMDGNPWPRRILKSSSITSAAQIEEKSRSTSERDRRKRSALIQHVLTTVINILVHLPVLVYQLALTTEKFMRVKHWGLILRLCLHLPFAITGNITLLMRNRNADEWAST